MLILVSSAGYMTGFGRTKLPSLLDKPALRRIQMLQMLHVHMPDRAAFLQHVLGIQSTKHTYVHTCVCVSYVSPAPGVSIQTMGLRTSCSWLCPSGLQVASLPALAPALAPPLASPLEALDQGISSGHSTAWHSCESGQCKQT